MTLKSLIKYAIILSFTFLLGNRIQAQTFAPEGSYWHTCWIGVGPIVPVIYKHGGIHEIAGKEAVLIYDDSPYDINFYFDSVYCHVAGDSTFLFHKEDSSYHLMFNFSLIPGDTFIYNNRNSLLCRPDILNYDTFYVKMFVSDTGRISVNNIFLRYYEMDVLESNLIYDPSIYDNFLVLEHVGVPLWAQLAEISGSLPTRNSFILPMFRQDCIDVYNNFYYFNEPYGTYFGSPSGLCWASVDEHKSWSYEVFPNPSNLQVIVKSEELHNVEQVNLIDLSGRILNVPTWHKTSEIEMNIEHLTPGLYFLHISLIGGHTVTEKIIKQ